MSRKTASNKNKADSEVEVIEENLPTGLEPEKVQETQDQDNQEAIECENTSILLSGKAKKLSPKSESCIYFDLVKIRGDEELYLKLTGNDSGGLFTKELIPMKKLINILKEYKDKSFKSTVLKPAIIEWTNGDVDLIVSRAIPKKSAKTSTKMFVEYGACVNVPGKIEDLKGRASLEQARLAIEKLFGIGNAYQGGDSSIADRNRISIRQATPYMYLTKNVVDSDTILMHGLDDSRAAPMIVGAMPFFLGAQKEDEIAAERRLKQLEKMIEAGVKRKENLDKSNLDFINKCHSLLRESRQVGIYENQELPVEADALIERLLNISKWDFKKVNIPNEDEINSLIKDKSCIHSEISRLKRKRKSALNIGSESSSFKSTVESQTKN
ncbi:hypothetical protein AB4356_13680 [Vibrio lentus]